MKDEQWNYLVHLSGTTGENDALSPFETRMYSNTLSVAFQKLIDIDMQRFASRNPYPRAVSIKYDQAKIIFQPTGDAVAVTRNYPAGPENQPWGDGLFLEVVSSLAAVKSTLGFDLGLLRQTNLPKNVLRLGFYDPDNPSQFIYHPHVDTISGLLSEFNRAAGNGICRLEIQNHNTATPQYVDTAYDFDSLRAGLIGLTEQDLSLSTSRSMRLSLRGELLIDVEHHSKLPGIWGRPSVFAAVPLGQAAIFYTIPLHRSIRTLESEVDLFNLPHFQREKSYFLVASYHNGSDHPINIGAFDKLKEQLATPGAAVHKATSDRFALEFYYQVTPKGLLSTGSIHFKEATDAIRTLSALEPSAFDTAVATPGQPRIARVELLSRDTNQLIATMSKTNETGSLRGRLHIMVNTELLTPDLKAAVEFSFLSSPENADKYHLQLVGASDLATSQRKPPTGRIITGAKNSGNSL